MKAASIMLNETQKSLMQFALIFIEQIIYNFKVMKYIHKEQYVFLHVSTLQNSD